MSEAPVRVLILLDGDQVAPEKSYLACRAQGGSLIAFQLAEQCRRWVSRELGKDAHIACLLFADVAHLCRSMGLPTEGVVAFAKGFSSTPTPCAFVHVLQGTTLAAISAHLTFLLPTLDFVFLGGFLTDVHAHHLAKVVKVGGSRLPKVILLETSQPPVTSVSKLAHGKTRFQGITEIEHQRIEDILTSPHHAFEDGYPARSSSSSSPDNSFGFAANSNVPPPSQATMARLTAFPADVDTSNPWIGPAASQFARTPPSIVAAPTEQSSATRLATFVSPPHLAELPPPQARQTESVDVARAVRGVLSRPPGIPIPPRFASSASPFPVALSIPRAAVPGSPDRSHPPTLALIATPRPSSRVASSSITPPSSLPGAGQGGGNASSSPSRTPPNDRSITNDPSPITTSPPSPVPSAPPSPSPSPSSSPSPALVTRGPTIPDEFLPLVKLIHSLQTSSSSSTSIATTTSLPSSSAAAAATLGSSAAAVSKGGGGGTDAMLTDSVAPLWSTIGSEISSSSSSSSLSSKSATTGGGGGGVVLPKGTKLKDFLLQAQRQGWVVVGKGGGEGREWVKVSKRGERALAKLRGVGGGGGGGGGGGETGTGKRESRVLTKF